MRAPACCAFPQSPTRAEHSHFSSPFLHRSMSCPAQLCSRPAVVQALPSLAVEHKVLPRVRISATFQAGAPTAEDEEEAELEDKSSEYSDVMQQRMGSSLTYRHEDGMNFALVLDDLIVGSCLQTPDDVDRHVQLPITSAVSDFKVITVFVQTAKPLCMLCILLIAIHALY